MFDVIDIDIFDCSAIQLMKNTVKRITRKSVTRWDTAITRNMNVTSILLNTVQRYDTSFKMAK